MRPSRIALGAWLLVTAGIPAAAQTPERPSVAVPTVPARPGDVASIDAIIAAFSDVISGPAGQPRQWARDRSLYVPGVRFVSTGYDREGRRTVDVMDHHSLELFWDGARWWIAGAVWIDEAPQHPLPADVLPG